MSEPNTFTVTLTAVAGDSRPAIIRLRAALKTLLRAYKLRCVRLTQTPEGT